MPKMIQIRNVPDRIHRILKARAARAQMNLSDYLLREVSQLVARPELDTLLARIKRRGTPKISKSPADVMRAERESSP